ncbi:spore coat protein U domain-containing protein [Psychrobacter cryohalolentis]|uniref:spore coat protein U domain-containing protein n=1 Tax=Psychrobacter sp. D2 TaxID=2759702 RepID=UPI0015E5D884|nr:spore coat protein U domain-containing protein [Psychrobacter sp. D2]MBA2057148.1 spore coat protein U domain-containing protein [Psychrobacter sp. D2]
MLFKKSVMTAAVFAVGSVAVMSANAETTGSFNTTLTVDTYCQISTAATAIALTTVNDGAAREGTSSIGVTCSKGTAYEIALTPGNADVNGSGLLKVGGAAGQGIGIPYQLKQTTTKAVWGSTLGVSGNALSATGEGVRVPSTHGITINIADAATDVTPGNYIDTINIALTL